MKGGFFAIRRGPQRVYLQAYLGQPPDPYQLARFFLMQQVAHIFYAMAYLFLGSSGKPVNQGENAPEFRDFHRRIWAGEVNLADGQVKTGYGRVHLKQLLENKRQTRFDDALRMVSDRHACAGFCRLLNEYEISLPGVGCRPE
jgi:hypothetical protein